MSAAAPPVSNAALLQQNIASGNFTQDELEYITSVPATAPLATPEQLLKATNLLYDIGSGGTLTKPDFQIATTRLNNYATTVQNSNSPLLQNAVATYGDIRSAQNIAAANFGISITNENAYKYISEFGNGTITGWMYTSMLNRQQRREPGSVQYGVRVPISNTFFLESVPDKPLFMYVLEQLQLIKLGQVNNGLTAATDDTTAATLSKNADTFFQSSAQTNVPMTLQDLFAALTTAKMQFKDSTVCDHLDRITGKISGYIAKTESLCKHVSTYGFYLDSVLSRGTTIEAKLLLTAIFVDLLLEYITGERGESLVCIVNNRLVVCCRKNSFVHLAFEQFINTPVCKGRLSNDGCKRVITGLGTLIVWDGRALEAKSEATNVDSPNFVQLVTYFGNMLFRANQDFYQLTEQQKEQMTKMRCRLNAAIGAGFPERWYNNSTLVAAKEAIQEYEHCKNEKMLKFTDFTGDQIKTCAGTKSARGKTPKVWQACDDDDGDGGGIVIPIAPGVECVKTSSA